MILLGNSFAIMTIPNPQLHNLNKEPPHQISQQNNLNRLTFAHLSIQSKQKRCVQPIVANSVRDEGASKQIAHVKSFGTVVSLLLFAEAADAAAATTEDLAAGFNSLRGTSSSSESLLHKSMGDSGALRVLCDAAALLCNLRRAELLLLLVDRLTVVEEEGDDIALLLSKSLFVLLLLLVDDDADAAVAKRVERR